MDESLTLILNGKERTLDAVRSPTALDGVLSALGLRVDRIAVELNGELAPRAGWAEQAVRSGDKLEIVHFVGGGRC